MRVLGAMCLVAVVVLAGSACQSPTSASSTYNVDNFVDATVTPNPATATEATDGRTYRVVRGNNQPDDILRFQYTTTFSVVLTLNSNATNSTNDIKFPVTITAAKAEVQQASGGIVSPPTGGDTEHYDSLVLASTSNQISQVGAGSQMTFQVWYSLPSNGREALITETIAMKDNSDSPKTFTKVVQVRVAP